MAVRYGIPTGIDNSPTNELPGGNLEMPITLTRRTSPGLPGREVRMKYSNTRSSGDKLPSSQCPFSSLKSVFELVSDVSVSTLTRAPTDLTP